MVARRKSCLLDGDTASLQFHFFFFAGNLCFFMSTAVVEEKCGLEKGYMRQRQLKTHKPCATCLSEAQYYPGEHDATCEHMVAGVRTAVDVGPLLFGCL